MATKERAPVAIHIRELLTRVWFLLWRFDLMTRGVSELSSTPRLCLVSLPLALTRSLGESPILLTVLILVLVLVLVLVCVPHLWHPGALPVMGATASSATPCKGDFGTWDGHQDCCNNSNGGDRSIFHLILLWMIDSTSPSDCSAGLDETNIKGFTFFLLWYCLMKLRALSWMSWLLKREQNSFLLIEIFRALIKL